MKAILTSCIALALLVAAPAVSVGDTFFSDSFANGSTVTNATPTSPTPTSASYEIISGKGWSPLPSLTNSDLRFGLASTSGGIIEAQALFATNPVTLTVAGDYIEMTIVFTNTAGLLTANGALGFGLYNSQQVFPVPGGMNGTETSSASDHATGNAQNWQGYVGQIYFTGSNSRIMTRAAQTGSDNRNQDLVTSGSGSMSYGNPAAATVGSATSAGSLTLTAGQIYTEDIMITLTDTNSLIITNSFYSGAATGGTLLSQIGGVASGSTLLTAGFDALAIGWYEKGSQATTIDISSIQITGHATAVTGPPQITSQPLPASVPAGAACDFAVVANGYSMTYQWHRYGTNLVDGGNISGAKTATLIISPASSADVASTANGYYVTVSGAGGFSTNSSTVSLQLRTAANLVWSGSGTDWDLNTTPNWLNGATPSVFNLGDNVTFNDTGIVNAGVNLVGSFLSTASVTVNASLGNDYIFGGSGNFAGPGRLLYIGGGHLTINNVNSYSGGTLISNDTAYLVLNNYGGLGSGPVTLGQAGGQMEIVPAGGASTGIGGDVVVADDFTIMYDANSSYGIVLLGNLAGTSGKTLTFTHNNGSPTASRIRVYGTNTVCAANIVLNNPETTFASYQGTGSQTYNGLISGTGSFMQKGTTTYLNNSLNTYSGGTVPATGAIGLGANSVGANPDSGPIGAGPLFLTVDSTTGTTANGMVFASGGPRTIANPIQYPSATNNLTLIIGGTNNLTFTGPVTLNGNDGVTPTYTTRIIQVTNTALTTFSGVVSGTGFGLAKTGNGILALNNTETYDGPTTVSNGTLQVNGQLAAASAVTVWTNGILAGVGTIGGPVTVNVGGALAPGDSIGTLTINNNLSLGGNLNIEVNKSASPTSDNTVVTGTLNNIGTGTVNVTNLGPALVAGDTFTLFNKAVANGGALSVTGANATWTNKLATDGTIAVLSVTATTATNISYSLSGTNLTLSWPANYLGWILQTNSVGVTSTTNWFALPNSQTSTQVVITLNPARTNVFYRLLRPF